MDLSSIQSVITTGLALLTAVFGFFAYNQKMGKQILREANADYKERNEQLEGVNDRLVRDVEGLERRIVVLESEKRLPLDELTKMIVNQHSEQIQTMSALTEQIGRIATYFGDEAKNAKTKDNR